MFHLVALEREQQGDVDSWMPFLDSVAATRRDLRTYELPVLGRGYRLMRPFIDGGMRRGIPDGGFDERAGAELVRRIDGSFGAGRGTVDEHEGRSEIHLD